MPQSSDVQYLTSFVLAGVVAPYIRHAVGDIEVKISRVSVSLGYDTVTIVATCLYQSALAPYIERSYPQLNDDYRLDDLVISLSADSLAEVELFIELRGQAAKYLRGDLVSLLTNGGCQHG